MVKNKIQTKVKFAPQLQQLHKLNILSLLQDCCLCNFWSSTPSVLVNISMSHKNLIPLKRTASSGYFFVHTLRARSLHVIKRYFAADDPRDYPLPFHNLAVVVVLEGAMTCVFSMLMKGVDVDLINFTQSKTLHCNCRVL